LADGSFKLLDKKSFAVLSQFKQQASVGIVMATAGFKLAFAQGEGRIKVKDLRKLHHLDQGLTLSPCCEDAKKTTINCLAFSDQGDSLAASSSDGKVHIYRLV
jgi:WD40 repeat protein